MSKNRLQTQTSPYLQQHAENPVDWYPWGEEALQAARQQNKLILLSIGYSACHWCHVMAHESFEDAATAEVMNRLFINIKVDREERPDLDKIYQTAHHILNQRPGGWPLTAILTPEEHIPFFVGTYFPKRPAHGMPAFTSILEKVHEFYFANQDQIQTQNLSLMRALQGMTQGLLDPRQDITAAPLDQARLQLENDFDRINGGFGAAPKFPHPTNLERLMRHWAATRDSDAPDQMALGMARQTLQAMAAGGIYDQLGGGFCRYSVDAHWMIPHFEKMLYDNGPLLSLYTQLWQATGDASLLEIIEDTGNWILREMQSPEGGYYSTLDADSEGEEGRFYVWDRKEIKDLLDENEYRVTEARFGLNETPNFEGHWHLFVDKGCDEIATSLQMEEQQVTQLLEQARKKLFQQRETRVRPGRDEKILTSWNGLMIKGMAMAGRVLDNPAFVESAERAADFIRGVMYRDFRLLATYKDGTAHLNAYLDDYVFLIDALLELLQARWRDSDLDWAIALADATLEFFEDKENGGFYFTAHDHEQLIQRPKPYGDDATPSGNGIAAYVLGRLGHLLGEQRYLTAAERCIKSAWQHITHYPQAHTGLLLAVEEYLYPPQTIVIRGEKTTELKTWLNVCQQGYVPRRMGFAIPANALAHGLLQERRPVTGKTVAYICSGIQCQAPVTELAELKRDFA